MTSRSRAAHPSGRSARLHRRTVLALALALGSSGPARSVEVLLTTDAPGCAPVSSGVSDCRLAAEAREVSVTWSLSETRELNGYDFELRWDAGELRLLDAESLFPEAGQALPFLLTPNDPDASRVAALSLQATGGRALFRLRFALAAVPRDGAADVLWSARGRGLSPESVALDDAAGGGLDFWKAACSDGVDNDGDGRSDFDARTRADGPAFAAGHGDAGCGEPAALREDPQCQDGRDNDGDGSVDFDGGLSGAGRRAAEADDACADAPWRDDESCGLGFELVACLALLRRLRWRRTR